jgi:hypothetical protein
MKPQSVSKISIRGEEVKYRSVEVIRGKKRRREETNLIF